MGRTRRDEAAPRNGNRGLTVRITSLPPSLPLQVYDITDYADDHPGGVQSLLRLPGQDNTEGFSGIQHPAKVWDMIQDYYVGEVKKEEHVVYTFKQLSKL